MRWCNTYGVGKNPNKFGDDVIIDLGIVSEGEDPLDAHSETVASIRLDKESVEHLIYTLQQYISD